MRVILSRKGFDSRAGKYPSPIMPDGRLLSLPIPVQNGERGYPYSDLWFGQRNLSEIIGELSPRRADNIRRAHLDPDLDPNRLHGRPQGWRPTFGQTGRWQSHLQNQGVQKNDLFLFFGWFRQTQQTEDGMRYERGSPDLHVIFGWLQIKRKHEVGKEAPPPWLKYHPHIVNGDIDSYKKNNTIYIATERLVLEGHNLSVRGAGTFPCFKQDTLQLTDPDEKKNRRSYWRLPKWFYHKKQEARLSCHTSEARWQVHNDYVNLHSVPQGQEFVLNTEYYPDAVPWVRSLFEDE